MSRLSNVTRHFSIHKAFGGLGGKGIWVVALITYCNYFKKINK